MRMYDIILKKRNGQELTKEEIDFFINGYTKGDIPDYQMSALLMAIYFSKMNKRETYDLTMAMAASGDKMDLSAINGVKVDKHSTGGVGDKTSLVVGPMVAAAGVPVAKMSGRGLGHTGGTIDKLESIPGFKTTITNEEFINNVNRIKIALVGQTANLAPADKKIYALRDVTATVDNLSLIASSIMSKKLSSGADGIVLDVKTGSGAFMKKKEEAIALAKEMVSIGESADKKTLAVVTNMDQPLGIAAGNAIEVMEAIDTLKGNGPEDLTELSLVLGANMLVIAGVSENTEEGIKTLKKTISDGTALRKMAEFIEAQGGNSEVINDFGLFPQAKICRRIKWDKQEKVYVKKIDTQMIGLAVLALGGGREKKDSVIDLAVGVKIHKKIGDVINKDEIIAEIFANDENKAIEAERLILQAVELDENAVEKQQLIIDIIDKNSIN